MKKRVYERNQSQVINNFYTLVTIVIMTVVITLYTKYVTPDTKEETPFTVLPCMSELKIDQTSYNKKLHKEALELFLQGNYQINGGAIYEENSKFDEELWIKKIDELFENSSQMVAILNAQKFLNIKYELINKESTEAQKVNLLVSFRISSNEVLRMYTFLDLNNIEQTSKKVGCIMESLKNAKK